VPVKPKDLPLPHLKLPLSADRRAHALKGAMLRLPVLDTRFDNPIDIGYPP
jgi:hypothetical protein